ncbi:MAG: RNA polymerase sigma factor [Pelotomaculum sp. PtaU1.Bin035]|nr:MAG: RNA polymerase sigma factor [Pelotomaculum sp. PtaU1.Bin035]
MKDVELVKRCQSGDVDAFELLIERFGAQAVRIAYLVTGRRDLAEDIAQEAFIQCIYSIKKLKKAIAAAACFTILGGGVSLAFSPGLQAWADEKANNLLNRVHMVTQTREVEGGVLTSTEIEFQDRADEQAALVTSKRNQAKAGGIAGYGPCATLAEAEKEAGFKSKVPALGLSKQELVRIVESIQQTKPAREEGV